MHKNRRLKLPKPMMVMIEGGLHGDTNLNIQEFMIVPKRDMITESVRMASEIFYSLKDILGGRGLGTNVGNEGAESPKVESNRQALDFLMEAARKAGYEPGKDVGLALDIAASEFYQASDQQYVLSADHASLSAERFTSLLKEWTENYPIMSLEDPLAEESWDDWKALQDRMPDELMIVGDDLFVTQKNRLQKGIKMGVANAVIIKPNQVGTVTETLATVKLAQENKYKTIVSHRAGETIDDFIADLAVGVGADYIKAGSVARGERVAKYNRLMQIEQELK